MLQVTNFEQLRADGKVISAAMTVKEMLARGWGPSKVVALRWLLDGKAVEYAAAHGVHGAPVPGANFVAAIVDEDDSGMNTRLAILSADGSIHGMMENSLRNVGVEAEGRYGWFEPAMTSGLDKFGAIFQTATDGDFRCDIDARDLQMLAAARIR